jgi:hypothetical protein
MGKRRVQADWDHVLIASADYYFYVSYPEGTNPFVALDPVLPIPDLLLLLLTLAESPDRQPYKVRRFTRSDGSLGMTVR